VEQTLFNFSVTRGTTVKVSWSFMWLMSNCPNNFSYNQQKFTFINNNKLRALNILITFIVWDLENYLIYLSSADLYRLIGMQCFSILLHFKNMFLLTKLFTFFVVLVKCCSNKMYFCTCEIIWLLLLVIFSAIFKQFLLITFAE
jgi:hypothetical protein